MTSSSGVHQTSELMCKCWTGTTCLASLRNQRIGSSPYLSQFVFLISCSHSNFRYPPISLLHSLSLSCFFISFVYYLFFDSSYICLPENPLPVTADVAYMIGIHPKLGGTWKEIFVYKSRRSVQIYHVLSHGRRFYRYILLAHYLFLFLFLFYYYLLSRLVFNVVCRSLEYTNDTRITLRDMQPGIDDRNFPWPKWERHGCGHPYNQHPNPLSVVITRDAAHPQNISGTFQAVNKRVENGGRESRQGKQWGRWLHSNPHLTIYTRNARAVHPLSPPVWHSAIGAARHTYVLARHIRQLTWISSR